MGNNSLPKPFNLLRWFSIASLVALLPVAALTGFILTHFITEETLKRDASQTAQFIQNCAEVEGTHLGLGADVTLAELLDIRTAPTPAGFAPAAVAGARQELLDHLSNLPDVLLATLFARDGRVVWSTNRAMVGTYSKGNDELEEAFRSRIQVAKYHASSQAEREEQNFIVQPKEFFIENYIPLYNADGKVVLVAEVYKEPKYLLATIKAGQRLVWVTTLASGILVYLGLFSIIRRGSALLEQQQRRLVETDALVFVGEMSTAVAHGLRNPLANIRSSAELALSTDDEPVRQNAQDIITQVDFLSRWVRELLLFSRPVAGEPEVVDLVAVLGNVLRSFAGVCVKAGVTVVWDQEDGDWPKVEGNTSLMTQALHSVISNAIEAMPGGGQVKIEMKVDDQRKRLELAIADTGAGMSKHQLDMALKPFHTTKRNGLGVGLPLVKRVMERFGGTLALFSKENEGTQVCLQFTIA